MFIISEVRLYREGLERLLRGDSRLDVIGGATDVPDALGHLHELEPRPDAVLLDVPAPVGLQAPGLLADRWYFFAQAKHPQNLYYQVVS